jgi:hypothetical protein
VNPSLLQRQAALAGVALLAVLGATAVGGGDEEGSEPANAEQEVAPADRWRTASVGVSRGEGDVCGLTVDRSTVGIVHPVLPCGAKLVVRSSGRTIRTEVVGRGPVGLEHEFDLTPALGSRLGVARTGEIRWRFAS